MQNYQNQPMQQMMNMYGQQQNYPVQQYSGVSNQNYQMQQYHQQQNFQNQMQQQHMAMQMNMQNRGWAPKVNQSSNAPAGPTFAKRGGRSRTRRARKT